PMSLDPRFVEAFGRILHDPAIDGSLAALTLQLPDERLLGQQRDVVDVDGLHAARRFAIETLAAAHWEGFSKIYRDVAAAGPYSLDRRAIDGRRLKNAALAYLTSTGRPEAIAWARRQFESADNMTDIQAALTCLVDTEGPEREQALDAFYR